MKTKKAKAPKKQTYKITVKGRAHYSGTIELTKAEYDAWEKRLAEAKGFEVERASEDLAEAAGIDLGDPYVDDFEIDDFASIKEVGDV